MSQRQVSLGRNRFALTRSQLLEDYAQISSRSPGAAVATSLRTESVQFRDIIAFEATLGAMDFSRLKNSLLEALTTGDYPPGLIPKKMAELGHVALLQNVEEDDTDFAVSALRLAISGMPNGEPSRRYRRLLVQQYIASGQDELALAALNLFSDIDGEYHGYLRAELENPFRKSHRSNYDGWLEKFNTPFTSHGLEPIRLRSGSTSAFDGLTAEIKSNSSKRTDVVPDPLVSVIMTTYRPSLAALGNSVKSLLNQSVGNLEIILVDDASPAEYQQTIEEVSSLDSRIRTFRMPRNSGTYLARNLGYAHARGEFITGQDDDDWSHPRRLEIQIAAMQDNPDWAGCRVRAIACTPNLNRVRVGDKPDSPNASSLMIRADHLKLLGGFLPVRKGADTELRKRLEIVTGRQVHELPLPLTIIRIERGSLSRSDYRAGWQHPARRKFRSAYQFWHASSPVHELNIENKVSAPISIPRSFHVEPLPFPRHLDVVFAGDWRNFGGTQKSMLEEIKALSGVGLRVGILHLEAPQFMSRVDQVKCAAVQDMVNKGVVTEVLYDDPTEIKLMILRYPQILQFPSHLPTSLKIRRLLILANQAPSDLDGQSIRYLVNECHENARKNFCSNVLWVPQDPQVREAISPYLNSDQLATYDMPGYVNVDEWMPFRTGPRSTIPVIGRHSRDDEMKWPEQRESLVAAYPTDGRFDVRLMGGAKVPLRVLGADRLPAAWTVYDTDELPVHRFLRMLDYFVFFQHSQAAEAFGREILEAIAAGLVVILPPTYEPTFGEAAVYATAQEVPTLVERFHKEWTLYEEQLSKAQKVLEQRFSFKPYVERVHTIIEADSTTSKERLEKST